jgi:signal transduction histidine kinase/CheY-like chemotaxis protein
VVFARVLLWFLPPDVLRTPESLRQARLLLGISAITFAVEPFFALRHFYVTKNAGAAYATLALAGLAALLPLLVRRGLKTSIAVQITCASIVVVGAGVSLARGGFLVTPLMAHIFLPLGGVLLDSRSVAIRWASIGAVNLTLLATAARWGLFGLAPASAAEFPQLLFFLASSSVLAVAYDHTRRGLDRDRVRLQEEVAAGQRLESLGHLAAGVAHDFNNLLMVFGSAASVMLDELPKTHPLREDAEAVEEAVARGVAITARLLSFARHEQTKVAVFDVRATVDQMQSLVGHALPAAIQIRFEASAAPLYAMGDPRELERVLLNLVVNARDAMPGGGEIRITTRREPAPPDARGGSPSQVVVSVSDNGAGIPRAVLPHIFEPFFTTKPRGAGTGLGLSTAWGIINAMGGDIRVESSPSGSRFELRIPEFHEAPSAVPPTTAPPAVRRDAGRTTVLLVDDQTAILRATKRLLEREGFRVLDASSGAAALDLLTAQGDAVDVLVTDVVMPNMSGVALAAAVRARRPRVRIVYVSGHFDDPGVRRDVDGGGARLLPKPFTIEGLSLVIADTLDARPVV